MKVRSEFWGRIADVLRARPLTLRPLVLFANPPPSRTIDKDSWPGIYSGRFTFKSWLDCAGLLKPVRAGNGPIRTALGIGEPLRLRTSNGAHLADDFVGNTPARSAARVYLLEGKRHRDL